MAWAEEVVKVVKARDLVGQRKGRFKDSVSGAQGKGPEGYCKCSKCGYRIKHERGAPCFKLKCPNCNINLKRE